MRYNEFEDTISPERMQRYLVACGNDTRRAMTLYRYNLKLSQEMFMLISCFEVSLRNRINRVMVGKFGNDWLRDFILPGGRFDTDPRVDGTRKIIKKAYEGLIRSNNYTHPVCIDTQGVLDCYARMMRLFQWMGINANTLLYGLDHVGCVSSKIMCI
jgi:hypothetical protein